MGAVNRWDMSSEFSGKSAEEAGFFYTGGPVEVAENTRFISNMSGVTAFETAEGLVLVDAGTSMETEAGSMAKALRSHSSAPVHTVIYTHGHLDHAYGLAYFLKEGQSRPRIIGHRDMPTRWERYRRTAGHQRAVNARQSLGDADAINAVFPDPTVYWRAPDLQADVLYDERLTLEIGGLTFDLHHAKGETDDHTWVYCLERRVLCPGDLIIWAVPNAGNPQKVQRYPWEWAKALREMAVLRPSALCPGHGGPVVGDPDLVQRILLETAGYLDSIVDQTLAALDDGAPPHVDIVQRVKIPDSASPWLQPVYDEAEFIVRNVIRYFGGWYSGRPSELKPSPRADVAAEIARLGGGVKPLTDRAEALAERGEFRLACHLADYALEAAPDNKRVQDVVARIYEQRAASETSLMAVSLFRSAAVYAKAGRAFA